MKIQRMFHVCVAALSLVTGAFAASGKSTNPAPDYSHANRSLPDGIITWDALMKTVDASNGQNVARFEFSFTNVAASPLVVLNVHPSCGCTTAELPSVPWTISARGSGQIKLSVNLEGKSGTLFKSVNVTTDMGRKTLSLRINILPPSSPTAVQMTEKQRAAGVAAAKLDRQAVFKGDCASCHSKDLQSKYGQQLFAAACAICHEANPRASMVPDLHHLTDSAGKSVPTDEVFWRSWITAGKEGTLMPAFAKSQGGPLTDLQIASLAAYLNSVNPSHPTQVSAK